MIQLDNNKNLYNIGCVGKIHSFNETDDGRYLISLHGTNCFKVIKEIKNNYSFRMIDAEIIENEKNSDLFNDQQKIDLLKKYENYIKLKNINLNLEDLDKIDLSQIIKFITMISPFKNEEKQSLLESSDLLEFYNKLISVIELELVSDLTNKSIN